MKVHCRTNLDLRGEEWPTEMPALPNIGDHIVSAVERKGVHLRLKVCQITWQAKLVDRYTNASKVWIPEIELGLTSQFKCVSHFTAWYDKLCGVMTEHSYISLCQGKGW